MEMLKRMQGASSDEEDGDEEEGGGQKNLEGLSEEEQMAALMGFGGFDTTKGKEVADNKQTAAKGHVAKHKRREYKQYMNKKGMGRLAPGEGQRGKGGGKGW